jgi:hypothetical protein
MAALCAAGAAVACLPSAAQAGSDHGRPVRCHPQRVIVPQATVCAPRHFVRAGNGFVFHGQTGFTLRPRTGFVFSSRPVIHGSPCAPVHQFIGPSIGPAPRHLRIGGTRQFYPRSFRGCRW